VIFVSLIVCVERVVDFGDERSERDRITASINGKRAVVVGDDGGMDQLSAMLAQPRESGYPNGWR
jgi:hypothetical protein